MSIGQFETAVPVADLWLTLADISGWPRWWSELISIGVDNLAGEGVPARLRLAGLPAVRGRVRTIEPETRVALQASFGPLLMDIEFVLIDHGDGRSRIVERVTIVGWVARQIGRHFARARGDDFSLSMSRLVSLAVVAAHERNRRAGAIEPPPLRA